MTNKQHPGSQLIPANVSAAFHQLPVKEQLSQIHLAHGKEKYRLIIDSSKPEVLVPRLHPQELYLTINDLGAEDSLELISLASGAQITLILDLDCWDADTLNPEASLSWLEFLSHCDEEKICQLARETEPDILALMLSKHLTIIRGLEAYDDDDAENAKRLESIYDIDYTSEDAAKVIGSLINIWQEREQNHFLQIMEIIRCENMSVLEEEVYQRRSARLLDLGIIPTLEARKIYAWTNPETFVAGGKKSFHLEADTLASPIALLKTATPHHFLAAVLEGGISHDTACEMLHLINRKFSADRIDLSSTTDIRTALQETYDILNLALEYLSDKKPDKAEEVFNTTWLQRLFQLGHSLVLHRQRRAEKIKKNPLFVYFDASETLFIDLLTQQPARHYCEGCTECPAEISAINTMNQLCLIDERLSQLETLVDLLAGHFAGLIDSLPPQLSDISSFSGILMTALANQLSGRDFSPDPLGFDDLTALKKQTLRDNQPTADFTAIVYNCIPDGHTSGVFLANLCLERWVDFFRCFDETSSPPTLQGFLLIDQH